MMRLNQQKQGVVFSLDAAIAVTVLIIVLINSAYYLSTSSKESLSQLQPVRLGSDILAILEYTGDLNRVITTDPAGSSFIDETILNLSRYLPGNYEMQIAIHDLQESLANQSVISGEDPFDVCENGICEIYPGDFVNFTTRPIETAGYYYVAIKTDKTNLSLGLNTLAIAVNNSLTGQPTRSFINLLYYDLAGAYIAGDTIPFYFSAGINKIEMNLSSGYQGPSPIRIDWFRVLGDESYALETDETPPTNRFIGTGERLVAAYTNDNFYGFHNVRFWIWLKSTP